MRVFIGVFMFAFVMNANAAVVHSFEFGNTANGGSDNGTLLFTSEGHPYAGGPRILSDYGEFKATIDGTYYDFDNIDPTDFGLSGGWTQTIDQRVIYDFVSPDAQTIIIWSEFEKGTAKFQYSVSMSYFEELTGFGIGAIWMRAGIFSYPSNKIINYSANVSYLHTTSPVPVPAAVWLFGSGLLGLIGFVRRKTNTH